MNGSVNPARVLVLSIGIERYSFGNMVQIPGAASEAVRFVRWALARGVPPDRIMLACSWTNSSGDPSEALNVRKIKTTQQALEDAIVGISQEQGDLLVLFWCGHGVVKDRERVLYTSDSNEALPRGIGVDRMLNYLRSIGLTGFDRQIVLIDACANFLESGGFVYNDVTTGNLPTPKPRETSQFVFFAAAQGQIASSDPINRHTAFSDTVLTWLEERNPQEMPPNLDALKRHVTEAFRRLRGERPIRQTPVTLWQRSAAGNEYHEEFDSDIMQAQQPHVFEERHSAALTLEDIEFVYVPSGVFEMGIATQQAEELARATRKEAYLAEGPKTLILLEGYYISKFPVTNRQYARFVIDTGHRLNSRDDSYSRPYCWDPETATFPEGADNLPVVLVSWHDSNDYCSWLSTKVPLVRLPTEAEWEKAARGNDGRTWAWGNRWSEKLCNTEESHRGSSTPVAEFSPQGDSACGAADMTGNTWEWCSSIFQPYPYEREFVENFNSPGKRVLRGGDWGNDRWTARCTSRRQASSNDYGFSIGFRIAFTPEEDA